MRTGSATAAAASIRRVEGVRANPSPARRLPIAVAKTSAPGATRSNGVANEFAGACGGDANDDDFAAQRLRIEISAEDLAALMRLKLPSGP